MSFAAMLSMRAANNSCASTVARLSAPRGRPDDFRFGLFETAWL
jgi:hypothetical protein